MKLSLQEQVLAPKILEENLAKIEANNIEIHRLRKENNKIIAYNTKLKKVITDNPEFFGEVNFVAEEETALVHEMFGKKYRDLTDEELKEYERVRNKKYYQEHYAQFHKKYDTSLSVKMFGKRLKDLNPEESREYYKQRQRASRERKESAPNNVCAMH